MSQQSNKTFMNNLMHLVAFFAVAFVGIALLLAWIFSDNNTLSGALIAIANVLAYIVVSFYAFFFAAKKWNRKQYAWLIIWAVSVTLIVIFFILNM